MDPDDRPRHSPGHADEPPYLLGWGLLVAASLGILIHDLRSKKSGLGSLIKFVWGVTVLYSGPIGLAVYWYSGRSQIRRDSLWRRGFRSVWHCYSGCGAGEITGVIIALGLLSLENFAVAAMTFGFAYVFGSALTVGPLVQEGVSFSQAMWDAFVAETPSIRVMEVVAIGTDLWLAGDAGLTDVLFWSALVVSLSFGLVAAYPVTVLLIRHGVKVGMMDPRDVS
jgi:hypothetical protein